MVKKYMKQILLTVFLNWEQFQYNSEEKSASEEILVGYHKYFRLFRFFLQIEMDFQRFYVKAVKKRDFKASIRKTPKLEAIVVFFDRLGMLN